LNFEVEECVRRAMIAQKEWSRTSFDERRAVLNDFIEMVLCNQEDICVASMNDTGKTSQYPFFAFALFFPSLSVFVCL
jgi:acyl-CoA reductase-like NAD-dependent aldehyde dehydrogenase